MGLPLRITYNEQDYIYQIIDSKIINQYTTELQLVVNGEKVELIKNDKRVWVQKDAEKSLDPELVQALGRSVSLRMRM
ncbi:hypothetical protein KXD93_27195 [Mucilaginibacter sp. BJC16-A38]|uniref:hypothetical protein n=1 Tax=Mucilaginibacter phenanthrenivorans TaxID=1234842 RepID=UPI00215808AD|nr:hypothetical protein [Mucilaginibacter phenanthrenivorans]MCR8561369.1 hypothetical protein [Mucilaginibacter phenanthrenivorans]